MCTKETGLLCLSAVVWGGTRAEFQGWEVRYELGETVIAREQLGETGSLETAEGKTKHISEWRIGGHCGACSEEAGKPQAT